MDPVVKNQYFPALTGMRAVGMYMVYLHHYGTSGQLFGTGIVQRILDQFYTGLVIFFVLSGFLITYRYFEVRGPQLREYVVSRIARVLPLYWMLTALTYGVLLINGEPVHRALGVEFLANVTLLKGLFDDLKFTGIQPGWSLTVEEMFYFSAPVIFLLVRRWTGHLLLIPILLLFIGLLLVRFAGPWAPYGFMDSLPFMFACTFFGRAAEFFIGCAMALLYLRYRDRMRFKGMTLIGAVTCFACVLFNAAIRLDYSQPLGGLTNNLILPLCMGVLFLGLVTERTMLSALLGSSLMVLLGRCSYAFYLIHMGVIYSFVRTTFPNAILVFLVINVVAWLIHTKLEEPLRVYIKDRFA